MLIYNTTFHVSGEHLLPPFLTYMRDIYRPAVLARGYVKSARFVHLLTDIGDDVVGYALMCEVEDVQKLKKWKLEIGRVLESNFHDHFGEKILMFSTTMKDVELKG